MNPDFILIAGHLYVVSAITRVGNVVPQSNAARKIPGEVVPSQFTFDCGGIEHRVATGCGLSVSDVHGFHDAIIQALMGESQ